MNFEDAMNQAMKGEEFYQEPSSNAPRTKRNIVSKGVEGIRAVLDAEAQQRANKREDTLLVGVPEKRVFRGHLPE